MASIIEPFVSKFLQSMKHETFANKPSINYKIDKLIGGGTIPTTALIISIILSQILFLIFGKWLWNSFLVPIIPAINPVNSIGHLLGLSILIKLLFN